MKVRVKSRSSSEQLAATLKTERLSEDGAAFARWRRMHSHPPAGPDRLPRLRKPHAQDKMSSKEDMYPAASAPPACLIGGCREHVVSSVEPLEFERALRSMGPRFDHEVLEATRALYRPHLDAAPAGEERVDVGFGPHPRHRLDVYLPASAAKAVVVFVHGGGFVGGDKNIDGVYYRNVGRWLARHGFAGVLPNYRLAPAHPWPAGAQDVGAAVEWVRDHRGSLGGGDVPVILWGQSAGAAHVATWLFDPRQRGREVSRALAGVMLMSGFYEVQAPLHGGPLAYFGDDAAQYADRSALTHAAKTGAPVWIGVAELDPGWLAAHSYALARALALAEGAGPAFHRFRGHNHVSTVQSLGSPHRSSGEEVLRVLGGWSETRAA
jgi:acetyl esterase/lipase